MEVLDIIRRAAFNSGVVSSFNPNEMPGDVENAGYQLLVNEILPNLNCDRGLDVAVTSHVVTPINNKIVLTPLPIHNEYYVLGTSELNATELSANFNSEAAKLLSTFSDEWPTDETGTYYIVAIWSADWKLVLSTQAGKITIHSSYSIPFPPMRIETVFEADTRLEQQYLYRKEFESSDFINNVNCYTIEEAEDCITVYTRNNKPKVLIIPIPLYIQPKSIEDQYNGIIKCPPKFKQYLIDALAFRLSVVYGVSTTDTMHNLMEISYNLLKKNVPMPLHGMNIHSQIRNTLRGGYFHESD